MIFVVDEQTQRATYDTVYVDLNYDYDFPERRRAARLTRRHRRRTEEPRTWTTQTQDGLNDISGGLVY